MHRYSSIPIIFPLTLSFGWSIVVLVEAVEEEISMSKYQIRKGPSDNSDANRARAILVTAMLELVREVV